MKARFCALEGQAQFLPIARRVRIQTQNRRSLPPNSLPKKKVAKLGSLPKASGKDLEFEIPEARRATLGEELEGVFLHRKMLNERQVDGGQAQSKMERNRPASGRLAMGKKLY